MTDDPEMDSATPTTKRKPPVKAKRTSRARSKLKVPGHAKKGRKLKPDKKPKNKAKTSGGRKAKKKDGRRR